MRDGRTNGIVQQQADAFGAELSLITCCCRVRLGVAAERRTEWAATEGRGGPECEVLGGVMWWVGAKGLQGKLTFAVNRRRAVRLAQDLITARQNRVHLHPQRLPPLLTQSHYLYFFRLLVSLCLSPLPLWEWLAHTVWKQSRTGRRGGDSF